MLYSQRFFSYRAGFYVGILLWFFVFSSILYYLFFRSFFPYRYFLALAFFASLIYTLLRVTLTHGRHKVIF